MKILGQILLIFVLSTVVFDLIHHCLHLMQKSRFNFFQKIGSLHLHHHHFFDQSLTNHPDLWRNNLYYHLIPEFLVQVMVTLSFLLVFDRVSVFITLSLELLFFVIVIVKEGKDPNHTSSRHSSRPRMNLYVFPSYHAYHHLFPDAYYSSWFRLTDLLLGSSWHIKGRRVLLTGSRGQWGSSLHRKLEALGAIVETAEYGKDYVIGNFSGIEAKARNADLLILCHGSKESMVWSHLDSNQEIISIFLKETKNPVPEIWGTGSEIEFHPALLKEDRPYEQVKREYAKFARGLYERKDIIYRHLVPSAFKSPYGPAPVSADFMASIALFFIKRGFRYIPISYTGIAYLNFFRFRKLL